MKNIYRTLLDIVETPGHGEDIMSSLKYILETVLKSFRKEYKLKAVAVMNTEGITIRFGDRLPEYEIFQSIDPKTADFTPVKFPSSERPGETLSYFRLRDTDMVVILSYVTPKRSDTSVNILVYSLSVLLNQKIRNLTFEDSIQHSLLVQSSLLPERFDIHPSFDIHCRTQPCELIGGDVYDLQKLGNHAIGITLADASGHGFPAALQARDIVIGLRVGIRKDHKITGVMETLNEVIHQSRLTSRFVSVFYGELEDNGNLFYVNAGHLAPLCIESHYIGEIPIRNPVLGPIPDTQYKMGFYQVNPGAVLVLYTDGITEELNADQEEFGKARLVEIVRTHLDHSAKEICDKVFEEVTDHCQGKFKDDCSLVIVKKK